LSSRKRSPRTASIIHVEPIAPMPQAGCSHLIRCKHIYYFWCSMLVLHQLLYILFTLHDIFMHFSELTY
jgi:hypothetical protein